MEESKCGDKVDIKVSVVIPVYNEEKYIANCIESILKQDYPREDMEFIFVDGGSKDATVEIIRGYIEKYPELIRLEYNPKKTAPCAMNIGIKSACGKYIVRLDAHSTYPNDYISKCIYYLELTGADNVGGFFRTESRTYIGKVMASMVSSPFGVGRSRFRIGCDDGYVDTVPYGAFRKSLFYEIGFFNEHLDRCEDGELNYRIRKNGGKVYISNDIWLTYYCRDKVSSMMKMAYQNGLWNVIAMYLCPGSMKIRRFVPLGFVCSLVALPVLAWGYGMPFFKILLEGVLELYVLLDLIFSAKLSLGKDIKHFVLLFVLFPIFHISFGIGSVAGLLRLMSDHKKFSGWARS